jgi:CubicO group peptidase (beta-lactamase class C family)
MVIRKIYKTKSIISIAALVIIIFSNANAQTYTVNGKHINIDSLNKQIEYIINDVGIAGLSFAVIDQNKIVFYNNYGYKNLKTREKIDQMTLFEACSLSKSFLAYLSHKLVDQGILDLDEPLYKYLKYDELEHDKRNKLITARMVLSHNSGIENSKEQNDPNILEIVEQPGTSFVYSGEGYIYLSKVISKLVNMPVEEYYKKMIYNPLSLKRTFTTYQEKEEKNYASGHDAFGDIIDKPKTITPDVAGRIHTNAKDYAKLLTKIFDRKHLTDSSINDFLKPLIKTHEHSKIYYGSGFEIFFAPNKDKILFQGGDNNGFKGLACYSIMHQSGIVFFSNSERAQAIGSQLCKIATGMDIGAYYDDFNYPNEYPNSANTIFQLYKKEGAENARKAFNYYFGELGDFTEKDMVELVSYFRYKNYDLAKYIGVEYLKKYPNSPANFVLDEWLKK